jgi:site-specific DNA recombinase
MSKSFIAYIRVSTQKQFVHGVSLEEQRRAIVMYAAHHQLTISTWREEVTTAAKRGRPVFATVIKSLVAGEGSLGLIMHKIDRGARNLKDWSDIGEVIDLGITVRFAHDNIDLHSRGGRLTADIQAVIAADYIRNLREEVRKGISGRLAQGLYPFNAPLGYNNNGRGRAKTPDCSVAPFILYIFQRYATGTVSMALLADELEQRGLTRPAGKPFRASALSKILRNEFYAGTLLVKGRRYEGIHQPLVSRETFDRVRAVLRERKPRQRSRHQHLYRGSLQCVSCERMLVGEKQKNFTYYRCHQCRGVCVREDRVLLLDPRFRIVRTLPVSTYPELEPWEKFESPPGIAQTKNLSSELWLC